MHNPFSIGRSLALANPTKFAYGHNLCGRITVPIPADGWSAILAGRQWRTLKPYTSYSASLPGIEKAFLTFLSKTSTVPPKEGASLR